MEITLERLEKRFADGTLAVQELDLEIADGELLVLVGPSGSGKSTVLRMIAGLETPSAGAIRIGGRDVTQLPPQERNLAMVFQSYALYPHMTVRENMAFGLRMRRRPPAEIRRRVEEVASILGLAPLLQRRPAQLSGGQRQRVALGRAIVREPDAFLFDEPLSNLDAKLRVETRAELSRLHRRLSATMVYVTHDQVEAMTLGDRVAVLRDGRLQQVAPPLTLYREPSNRFVAGFIGSPAMNFLEGELRRDTEKGVEFVSEDLVLRLDAAALPAADASGSADMRRAVVLGIRPQDVALEPAAAADGGRGRIRAVVSVVEPTGSEQVVHLNTGSGLGLLAVLPAEPPVAVDDAVTAIVPARAAHLFGRSDGRRIAGPRAI